MWVPRSDVYSALPVVAEVVPQTIKAACGLACPTPSEQQYGFLVLRQVDDIVLSGPLLEGEVSPRVFPVQHAVDEAGRDRVEDDNVKLIVSCAGSWNELLYDLS